MRSSAQHRAQHLSHGGHAGRELETDNFCVSPALGRSWVVAVGDKNFCVMAGAGTDAENFGMKQSGFEHGVNQSLVSLRKARMV